MSSVFSGCQITLETDSGLPYKKKLQLKQNIIDGNGTVSFIITKKTTHFVVSNAEKAQNSYKTRMAQKLGIPIVDMSFIDACVGANRLLEPDQFIVGGKTTDEEFSQSGKIIDYKTDYDKAVAEGTIKKTEQPTLIHLGTTGYKTYYDKAAAEGTVKTKRTNLSLSGASGAGKTSTLRLLTGDDPVLKHCSTSVLQSIELIKDDEETSGPVDPSKQYLLVVNEHKWNAAPPHVLYQRIANAVHKLAHAHEDKDQQQLTAAKQTDRDQYFPQNCLLSQPPTKLSPSYSEDLQAVKTKVLSFIDTYAEDIEDMETHFINVSDTGGQAAFIDVAPALMRFHSINLVLVKLTESLHSPAKFFYCVNGKKVGEESRKITTKSLVLSIFSSKMKIQRPDMDSFRIRCLKNVGGTRFMILGTYFDEYTKKIAIMEKLEKKNEELLVTLEHFKDILIQNGDEVIHPLNTLSRDEETLKLASSIRELATSTYVEAEVPVRWYLFQIAINEIKISSQHKDIFKFEEFFQLGSDLCEMSKEEVEAALLYFHDLNICLYYRDVLPNVVFATPQCLFDKLSEIIAVALNKDGYKIVADHRNKLTNEGILCKDLLNYFPKGFVDNVFTADDFLCLMEYLFVITPVPGNDMYFMPCVLLPAPKDPMEMLPDSATEPLLLSWDSQCVPSGLFPSLVASLSALKSLSFKIAKSKDHPQYRNKITMFCRTLACQVIIFEYSSFIGVATTSDKPKHCHEIHQTVLEGIKSVVERFHWVSSAADPDEGFACKMEECDVNQPIHICHPDRDRKELLCSVSGTTASATDEHFSWYNTTTDTIGQSGNTGGLQRKGKRQKNKSGCKNHCCYFVAAIVVALVAIVTGVLAWQSLQAVTTPDASNQQPAPLDEFNETDHDDSVPSLVNNQLPQANKLKFNHDVVDDSEVLCILSNIPLTTKLQSFCIHLGLPSAGCSEIVSKSNDYEVQRNDLLQLWGEKKRNKTWSDFIIALDITGYCSVANSLADEKNIEHEKKDLIKHCH